MNADERENVFLNAVNLIAEPPCDRAAVLYEKHGSFERVFAVLSRDADRDVDPLREYERMQACGVRLVARRDPEYPALLAETHRPPLGLYVAGDLSSGVFPFAVVGTRKATRQGESIASEFAQALAARGCTVISGMAYGIDEAAHRGALQGGATVAVLGFGIDGAQTSGIAQEILRHRGALVSEYPLGMPGTPYHFPLRNRIIAGMSRGVLVVEAPIRSGALITARLALENNRDVFVIPGSIRDRNYEGNNALLREGAILTRSVSDVFDEYGMETEASRTAAVPDEAQDVYALISAAPRTAAEIATALGKDPDIVLQIISVLELQGTIKRVGDTFSV